VNIGTFSQNVKHDDVIYNMKMFFDQHIAMYNIIDKYNIGEEVSAQSDKKSITYRVVPFDTCDIDNIISSLTNATISLYKNRFNINIIKDGNALIISLTEKE
jgi:ferredoxin-fold anticodon binding domain-containing protein